VSSRIYSSFFQALWFANNAALKDHVILRPAWFFDIFRSIFRHDLKEKLEIEVEDSFRAIGKELVIFKDTTVHPS